MLAAMDFVRATSVLIDGTTLGDLAAEMGVTRGFIGQSRLDPANPQYRKPPAGWEAAVARLAARRSAELARVAQRVGAASRAPGGRSKAGGVTSPRRRRATARR
jgi:hypothetical protein